MQKRKLRGLTAAFAVMLGLNLMLESSVLAGAIRAEAISENGVEVVACNVISENSVSTNSLSENEVNEAKIALDQEADPDPGVSPAPNVSPSPEPSDTPSPTPTQTPEPVKVPLFIGKASITQLKMESVKSVRISWESVEGADSYEIYRSLKKGSKYTLVKTVKAPATSCVDKTKKLVTGKNYYYKVRAVGVDEGVSVYGDYSKAVKILYSLPAPVLSSAKTVAGGGLKLTWKKVKGAEGYVIYRGEKENGKFKKIATVETSSIKNYTIPASDCNGSYFYRVKAYVKSSGKKIIQSDFSQAKSATVQIFAGSNESYAQKCSRVFGGSYQYYASDLVARQNMTTITVNVWELTSSGDKVSKTKSFMIHKNLAPTVEQIFKEIYEGNEKFPIQSVGGYSWRGAGSTSEHNQGCAIDINPTQNAMIEGNGTVSSGSYWRPGTDPYSIPADGEVVKIFAKYGFRWGGIGWSSGRKDYMHFSYFGG